MYNEFCDFYFKEKFYGFYCTIYCHSTFRKNIKGINCFFLYQWYRCWSLEEVFFAAGLMKMSFFPSYIAAVLGNMLPIPFILLFIEKIFAWMKKSKHLHKIPDWLEKKALSKSAQIEKYGYLGLFLFCSHSAAGYRCLDRKSYRSIIRYET